jgi:uncharacterized protein YndB with AHSA1/START domain
MAPERSKAGTAPPLTPMSSQPEAADREFVITRTIDAPRALVFRAWTDPKQMARWWGPRVFTNPVCELDARPGGTFLIVMRGPDGVEYPYRGAYLEVVEPERIVYTDNTSEHPEAWHEMVNKHLRDGGEGKTSLQLHWTVTFEELDGKTKLTIRALFPTAATRDAFLKIGMSEGWAESLERLDALVATD